MRELSEKSLKGCIEFILDNYIETKENDESNEQFLKTIEENNFEDIFKSEFKLKDIPDESDYEVKMLFKGMGGKPDCPSIPIFYKKITNNAQKGYYVVFLFNKDMSGFYVSLNQGTTWYADLPDKSQSIEYITDMIRKELEVEKSEMDLKSGNPLPKSYEKANIYSCFFDSKDFNVNEVIKTVWKCLEYLYKIKEITNDQWEKWNYINVFSNYCEKNIKEMNIEENEKYLKSFHNEYGTIEDFNKMNKEQYVYINKENISKNKKLPLTNALTIKEKNFGPSMEVGVPKEKYGIAIEKGKYVFKKQFGKDGDDPDEVWKKIRQDLYNILENVKNAKKYNDIKNIEGLDLLFVLKLAYAYFPNKLIGIGGANNSNNFLNDVLEKMLGYKEEHEKLSKIQLSFLVNQKIREIDPIKKIPPETLTILIWNFCSEKFKWKKQNNNNSQYIIAAASQNGKKYIDEFIEEKRWQHFFQEGNRLWKTTTENVNRIKVGSKIVLKSGKNNKTGMKIWAIGTVTRNYKDGCNIEVIWKRVEKDVEGYGGPIQNTLTIIDYNNTEEKYKKLVDFIFNSEDTFFDWNQYENHIKEKNNNGEKKMNSKSFSLNTILQGPPGTGKTYMAKRYAVAICDNSRSLEEIEKLSKEKFKEIYKDFISKNQIVFTTFHQSYDYEDFVEGIRPKLESNASGEVEYIKKEGIFKRICEEASKEENKDRNYVLIIDEINRGNISKIFGELITLIEEDKRKGRVEELEVVLPYSENSDKKFSVPSNLYIIGTMNTADRSIALMDTALRRRFRFEDIKPNENLLSDKIIIDGKKINIKEMLKSINERIDILYDKEHEIGHSYFLSLNEKKGQDAKEELKRIFQNEIIPLLQEYFFDDYGKIQLILGNNNFIVENSYKFELFKNSDNNILDNYNILDNKIYYESNRDKEVFNNIDNYIKIYS